MNNKLIKLSLKKTAQWTLVLLLGAGLLTTFTGCNPDEGGGTPSTDDGGNTQEEYLIIEGQRYEGKDFYKKTLTKDNSNEILIVEIGPKANYPVLYITQQRKMPENVLVARDYIPNAAASYDPDFDDYTVRMSFGYGPPPNDCFYIPLSDPSPAHEKYTLKQVDGKWVSEFGKAQMDCNNKPANGADQIAIEGYIIWENKN